MVQDGPPPGGFPSVRIARRIPSTGPGGFTVFAVSSAIMAYGFYLVSACRQRAALLRTLLAACCTATLLAAVTHLHVVASGCSQAGSVVDYRWAIALHRYRLWLTHECVCTRQRLARLPA